MSDHYGLRTVSKTSAQLRVSNRLTKADVKELEAIPSAAFVTIRGELFEKLLPLVWQEMEKKR